MVLWYVIMVYYLTQDLLPFIKLIEQKNEHIHKQDKVNSIKAEAKTCNSFGFKQRTELTKIMSKQKHVMNIIINYGSK